MPASLACGQPQLVTGREVGEQLGSGDGLRPKLEMSMARAAHGAAGQERTPQVRGPAAGARDDPPRWSVEWNEAGIEDPCLVQRLHGTRLVTQV